jgi:hypothetical protein
MTATKNSPAVDVLSTGLAVALSNTQARAGRRAPNLGMVSGGEDARSSVAWQWQASRQRNYLFIGGPVIRRS